MGLRNIAILAWLLLIQAFISIAVYAEGGVKDRSELVGTWVLESTALRQDGDRSEEHSKWEFTSDGRLNTTIFYEYAPTLGGEGAQIKTTDTFDVRDGTLVTGRDTYELLQRQGNEMVLKSKGLFYFLKRQ